MSILRKAATVAMAVAVASGVGLSAAPSASARHYAPLPNLAKVSTTKLTSMHTQALKDYDFWVKYSSDISASILQRQAIVERYKNDPNVDLSGQIRSIEDSIKVRDKYMGVAEERMNDARLIDAELDRRKGRAATIVKVVAPKSAAGGKKTAKVTFTSSRTKFANLPVTINEQLGKKSVTFTARTNSAGVATVPLRDLGDGVMKVTVTVKNPKTKVNESRSFAVLS